MDKTLYVSKTYPMWLWLQMVGRCGPQATVEVKLDINSKKNILVEIVLFWMAERRCFKSLFPSHKNIKTPSLTPISIRTL